MLPHKRKENFSGNIQKIIRCKNCGLSTANLQEKSFHSS
nr:MAG TPA: 50S ribosomal protein bL37 [Caudoviricetes sp.]